MGVTPEGVEVPRSLVDEEMREKLKSMPEEFRPSLPKGPDCKWRYMWRVGPRPSNTRFQVSHLSLVFHQLLIVVIIVISYCRSSIRSLSYPRAFLNGRKQWIPGGTK